jgi:hypothetical protein
MDVVAGGWQFLFFNSDFKTATKRFNQAWLLDENNIGCYVGFSKVLDSLTQNKIITLEQKNELSKTIQAEIDKRDPKHELFHLETAVAHTINKNEDNSWKEFNKAKNINSKNEFLNAYKLLILMHLGDSKKAKTFFTSTQLDHFVFPYKIETTMNNKIQTI